MALALLFLHYRMLNAELKAREQAEASLRTLSVRLLELQDQERRRFSRELHDSLGQYLVGAKMNLAMLDKSLPENALIGGVSEASRSGHDGDPYYLASVASPFAGRNRFCVRGKMVCGGVRETQRHSNGLDMPEDFGRLPSSLELALFRVLQESLTNVHRHSTSSGRKSPCDCPRARWCCG